MSNAPQEPVLVIEDLCVSVRGTDRHVVRNLSLSVGKGEIVCIVGESGSGKSVTSLAIMGLLPPGALSVASGRIVLRGEDLVSARKRRLRQLRATSIAMIFQEPMTALNPFMTIGAQIDEVVREHTDWSRSRRRAAILEMLRDVRLPDVERIYSSYPHQISGGQRQRAMIAMALVLRPGVLIADEPTTALDVTTQKQIIKIIKELQASRGTSIIFITHDMGVVSELADRVVVMKDGRLVEQGTRDEILSAPTAEYTRSLLNSVPGLTPRMVRAMDDCAVLLRVSDLGKTYRGSIFGRSQVDAAKDVSFELRSGRTVGIVGESGSGKSTVARCIVRLIDPTSGDIRIGGQSVCRLNERELRPFRRRIQYIFQDPNRSLNPRLTIGESLVEGPMNFGVARSAAFEKGRRLLARVGLPADSIDRYPHQFSGGQRQRIAIARALAMDPEILIADEAVSALDVSIQAQVLELLESLQAELGLGILFITHDLRVAAQICDEIVVINGGRVVESGPSSRLLVEPSSQYARELLESVPGRHWNFQNI